MMHRFLQQQAAWAARAVIASIALLFCCSLGARGGAASPAHRVALGAAGLRSAFADFDGDVHPDVATLQSDNSRTGTSHYAINLQLSAAGRKSIEFLGPSGGLLLEARDVNGDNMVDLVLASAWQQTPVAIYLNDGHGDFSRAATIAFPSAFDSSEATWSSSTCSPGDSVGAPPRLRIGACMAGHAGRSSEIANDVVASLGSFPCAPSVFPLQGRAPPSSPKA